MIQLRHVFYTQRYGGKWRTARVQFRCDWRQHGVRCFNRIAVGDQYFDTALALDVTKHTTYRICKCCAEQEIDG
jgi:hypothetical protein